jgi:hypothetical protein
MRIKACAELIFYGIREAHESEQSASPLANPAV